MWVLQKRCGLGVRHAPALHSQLWYLHSSSLSFLIIEISSVILVPLVLVRVTVCLAQSQLTVQGFVLKLLQMI